MSEFMRVVHFWMCGDGEKLADVRDASTYDKWSTAYGSDANWSCSKALRGCGGSMKVCSRLFFDHSELLLVMTRSHYLRLSTQVNKPYHSSPHLLSIV